MSSAITSFSVQYTARRILGTYELSESRYLWTSKMSPVVVPSGLVTVKRAGPEPFDTKVCAEV